MDVLRAGGGVGWRDPGAKERGFGRSASTLPAQQTHATMQKTGCMHGECTLLRDVFKSLSIPQTS